MTGCSQTATATTGYAKSAGKRRLLCTRSTPAHLGLNDAYYVAMKEAQDEARWMIAIRAEVAP